jgi:hypothetical protein
MAGALERLMPDLPVHQLSAPHEVKNDLCGRLAGTGLTRDFPANHLPRYFHADTLTGDFRDY